MLLWVPETATSLSSSPSKFIFISREDSTPGFGAFGGRGGGVSLDSVSVEGGTEEGFSRGESGGVGIRRRLDVGGSSKTSGSSTKMFGLLMLVITFGCFCCCCCCCCCCCLFLLLGCGMALLRVTFWGAGDGLFSYGEKKREQ